MSRLFFWSSARGEWVSCPPDEITWLDRDMLSGDEDLTLHRAPRCAGLRYVHRRWELFSRDTTYRVYLAPQSAGTPVRAEAVRRTACHVLPVAPARYEALPVTLAEGSWLGRVGEVAAAAGGGCRCASTPARTPMLIRPSRMARRT